jgi:DNA-binding NarL/FixJ family response regulator
LARLSGSSRVLIADYSPTRAAVRAALGTEFEVCAEAGDADEAIAGAVSSTADICVIGMELPGGGITAVRGIAAALPNAAIVVLAGEADADALLDAVRAGAVGYVPAADAGALQRVVRAVAAREAAIPRSMVLDLMAEIRASSADRIEGLTRRESQVLTTLRRGGSTSEIARELNISPVTVRRHISELVRKLGVADRAGLIRTDDE